MPNRKKVIALVFPPVPSYSRKLTLGIVERHLAHRDWAIIELPKPVPGQSPFVDGGMRPDGVITMAEARDTWLLDLVRDGIPVVNCGTEWEGIDGICSVHHEFEDILKRMISHFMDLGIKRVVTIGHLLDKRPATRRILERFVELARASGMDSRLWELDGEDSPSVTPRRLLATDQEQQLAAFLRDLKKPAGIFCFGDHIGFIVAAVASRLGIRIPKYIAIAGYGDNMVASFADPPLTTIDGLAQEVGRAAADCLADWLEKGTPPFTEKTVLGAILIERESTVGKSGNVILEAVHRYIGAHAKTGVSLDELVTLSRLSTKTLVRKYREHFGLDPMHEVHQRRIEEIKLLLDQPSQTPAEIAVACGFSSQAAFANYFRRHAGYTPGEYRQHRTTETAR